MLGQRFNSVPQLAALIGPFTAACIGLAAGLPVLQGVPTGVDTLFHLFRAAQLDSLVEQGILFSRWAPDLVYGYGYPLFNYYAPLSYYMVEVLHLAGFSLSAAFLATFAGAFALAALAFYLWARTVVGEAGALVGSALYALSPYLLLTAFQRGALAEHVALAWAPLCLWAFQRWAVTDRRRYALAALLAYSALILTHNITALLFTPLLGAYLVLLAHDAVGAPRRAAGRTLVRAAAPLLAAIGLTTFYWLPAIAEQDLVQTFQLFAPQVFHYDMNFLTLTELLALPPVVDPDLLNQHYPISLSLITVALSFIGIIGLVAGRRRLRRGQVAFAALLALASILMALPISDPLWRRLPVLELLQFPWRFLGLASLLLALTAAFGFDLLSRFLKQPRWRAWTLAIVVLVITLYAMPWQQVSYYDELGSVSVADSIEYELESGLIGTTSTGEYLPVDVLQLPAPDPGAMARAYARLDRSSLPEGALIVGSDYAPLAYSVEVKAPQPFTAVFDTFFFPGWQAEIDGQPAIIEPTRPEGLISLAVPGGQHLLEVTFQTTPLRQAASWISLAVAAIVLGLSLYSARTRGTRP